VAQQYCQQALALATELGIPPAVECKALQLKNQKFKMRNLKWRRKKARESALIHTLYN
jgi:hypothetical protein